MIILGINAYHGDASATLLRDGELLVAVEEERFRRVKHWAGFPREAIRVGLEMAGIAPAQVDHLALSRDPRANLLRKVCFTIKNRPSASLVRDRVRNAGRVRGLASAFDALGGSTNAGKLEGEEAGRRRADISARLHFVEHHPAHLASTFFASPFDEAAVCAIDGFGDFVSTSIAIGRGSRLEVVEKIYFPHSLGLLCTWPSPSIWASPSTAMSSRLWGLLLTGSPSMPMPCAG